MSSNVSVRKKQPSNVGPWSEDRTSEERSEFFRRAARAQWGPKKIPPKKANDGPWTWPIDLERYDRSPHLTRVETNMLTRYAEAYKFYRYGRTMDFGAALNRLVRPLNEVLDYTGIITNRRKYVLLFFLREMAERKRPFGDGLLRSGLIRLTLGSLHGSMPWRLLTCCAVFLICIASRAITSSIPVWPARFLAASTRRRSLNACWISSWSGATGGEAHATK